jgi:hypothetical protein
MQAVLAALKNAEIVSPYYAVEERCSARIPILKFVDTQTGTLLALLLLCC